MKVLTRDEILSLKDGELIEFAVPEWSKFFGEEVSIHLKSMTASERDAYETEIFQLQQKGEFIGMRNFRARLLSWCICDAEGNRLFNEGDIEVLSMKNARPVDRIFDKAREMNGLLSGDIKRMTENLPNGQSED